MSRKSLLRNHTEFEGDLEKLIRYGLRVMNERAPAGRGKRTQEEKAMLLEGLLLKAWALWERFIEKEVVYLINLDPDRFKEHLGLPLNTKLNIKVVRAILYSGRYQDYQDLKLRKGQFKRIISDKHNAFDNITNEQMQKLTFTYKLRNYLSHYSDYSRKKLFEGYKKNYRYRRFLEPGAFLLKQGGTHFERLLHNFVLVSGTMKKTLRSK